MDNKFVKIEDKRMPVDNYKNHILDKSNNNYQSGFISLFFLPGLIITSFMWAILILLGR